LPDEVADLAIHKEVGVRSSLPNPVSSASEGQHMRSYGFKSQVPPPTILYVCRKAFGVASKTYSRAFGTCDGFAETWFSFETDILYLDWGGLTIIPLDTGMKIVSIGEILHLKKPTKFRTSF